MKSSTDSEVERATGATTSRAATSTGARRAIADSWTWAVGAAKAARPRERTERMAPKRIVDTREEIKKRRLEGRPESE